VKTSRRMTVFCLASLAMVLGSSMRVRADAREDVRKQIRDAQQVFHELMDTPDRGIPHEMLESAKCIAIIPGVKKAAFVVGAEYGRGLAMCRTEHSWSGPVFVKIAGGSFGLQIGGSSTDFVLVFRNRDGMERLLSDKFKVGTDASAAAGPVGRDAHAATDAEMHAEILSYSRSRGVFAGVSLDGAVVEPLRSDDEAIYGADVTRDAILEGRVPTPEVAQGLVDEITRHTTKA
jgi:lipid-binding SYLF domain-containing protein